jgi:Na+/H+-dicarboxylate symporter
VTLTAGTFRPGTSQTSTFISAVKTFLSSINTAIDVTLDGVSLAVWSRVNADIYPVTQIQVGDVLDVQRRRRDTLVEAITSTTFP